LKPPINFFQKLMQQNFLFYKDSKINYLQFGSGQKIAVCFHGYGENAGSFVFLEKYAGSVFTFISIDLPFHGKTEWKDGFDFSAGDLANIVHEILKTNNLAAKDGNPFLTLIGFSLGGRMVLSLYEMMPQHVEKILLLAPDGLKVNFWYWLSTQTWAGNRLFSFTMHHPGWFFGLLKLFNRLGLVNAGIFKFVNHYIRDKEIRKLLYLRWTSLRKIKPNVKKIKALISTHETRVNLVYGQHDRIILPARGRKFVWGIEPYATLNVIPSGHQVLDEKHAKELISILMHENDNP
jgi:pimeloyl-ACP methyl ester carboxylesterase